MSNALMTILIVVLVVIVGLWLVSLLPVTGTIKTIIDAIIIILALVRIVTFIS